MSVEQIIEADLTWIDDRFVGGAQVRVDADGRIAEVGAGLGAATRRLAGRALLPGFVNAHSHAFQRGLRGRGETFGGGAGSFWSWREAMYDLVDSMDAPRMLDLSTRAFREMRAAGITTVGEFHYLHHDQRGAGFAFDDVILEAARMAGIRLVLLGAYYRTGGFDQPLEGGQRRFAVESPDAYWAQMDALASRLDPATQTLGAVAHSIRAAPIDDVAALFEESERRAMVFHMHVEEQPREIEECVAAHHQTPLALLNDRLRITPRFTAVHCTHSAAADMSDFLDAGGNVCICPLTEANLGDGIADLVHVGRRGGRVCLGTDSNARISMLEEMRWLEYGQRLRTRSRGVCTDDTGDVARAVLACGTTHGARALGVRAGSIETGRCADFATIDLSAPALDGWTDETLLAMAVLGAGDEVIDGTCVGGRWDGGVR
jgi:formimidoylglutamate deiminase